MLTSPSLEGTRPISSLTPAELKARLSEKPLLRVIDVREYPEFAAGRIVGARSIPLATLHVAASKLDRKQPVVCICRSGKRSAQAAEILAAAGFEDICQLTGGMTAWTEAHLPIERDRNPPWALERQVRLAAGCLALAGLGLSVVWPPAVALTWFVGAGLVFAGLTDWCGMGLLLARMPWNRACRPRCAKQKR